LTEWWYAVGSVVSANELHPTPTATLELGLDTFGEVTVDADGRLLSQAQVIRDVIAEADLADSLGVDFFGVGEASPRRLRDLRAGGRARRHRLPYHAHATLVRGNGAQLRRPDPRA
jgi:hypothetical protein